MVKAGLLGFAGRRKSHGNVMDEAMAGPALDVASGVESPSGSAGGGGFRLMSTSEAEARKMEERRKAQEKAASKFRPFSGFSAGNKSRNRSFDDGSPGSSKRDSKSSSGTQSSRPYNNGQFGSTSTLPSSADTDSNDNMFAIPRHHVSPPGAPSANTYKKQLPPVPSSESRYYREPTSPVGDIGRVRAMTSSSYASTAKPPTIDADMNFGSSTFDDIFGGLDRKPSPEHPAESPGRSLLAGKRAFHAEPIKIDRKLDVEAPLESWDSRGSTENLMSSPRSPSDDSPPPPVPLHKYGQYAPVASHSPELSDANGLVDNDASSQHQPAMSQNTQRESSSEQESTSLSSSSAPSLQTPLSSRSGSDITTPKATFRVAPSPISEDGDDHLFVASPKQKEAPVPAPAAPAPKEESRPEPPTTDSSRRILTEAEFIARQQRAMQQQQDESSEEEDYDEEEAQERATQEALARRKKQQIDLAREHMRRMTTAPGSLNRPDSVSEPFSMGFPSETSLKADEWEDEDIPLAILAQHGFPSKSQNKAPVQPANAIPSYLPDRPLSAGAGDHRASTFRPVFARNLPDDPHASFIGGGLVRPTNRESLGFNNGFSRGPASIAGDSVSSMPTQVPMMVYPEPQLSAPSLVEQIHMRDMTKQKYMGGASAKKPQEGPFTGMLGAQMNPPVQSGPGTRMSMMPSMGMGMNMLGGPMGMPMMGGQMAYPMQQQNDMMQMQQFQQLQQMLAAQQLQIQQMQMQQQQQAQDPRMSMAFPSNMSDPRLSMVFPASQMAPPQHDPRMSMASSNFLSVPTAQRPMSIMQVGSQQTPTPPRPFSQPMAGSMAPTPPLNGYTPSIAPSERSNIGLSARYRPVQTHTDAKSSSSMTMTLQASGGANPTIKGTLKSKTPVAQEDDDDAWRKMAARKSKYPSSVAKNEDSSLSDIMRGLDNL